MSNVSNSSQLLAQSHETWTEKGKAAAAAVTNLVMKVGSYVAFGYLGSRLISFLCPSISILPAAAMTFGFALIASAMAIRFCAAMLFRVLDLEISLSESFIELSIAPAFAKVASNLAGFSIDWTSSYLLSHEILVASILAQGVWTLAGSAFTSLAKRQKAVEA